MKDIIKYMIGIMVGITVFSAGILFVKKQKKTYSKQPNREFMV